MNEQVGFPRVRGRCPSCGAESLFLGSNGYVTCSVIGCKDPGAPTDVLALGPSAPPSDFVRDIEAVINRHSRENGSNTPDFILAVYLSACLKAFDSAVIERERWHGREIRLIGPTDSVQPSAPPSP